jgi:predicted phosphodiesterase
MSDISFLFRYRDLVAHTIDEHRKVIDALGWCWWGWWKRPSENHREDIWNDLEEWTKARTAVPVALFDSGAGHVYTAHVTAVLKPLIDENGVVGSTRVLAGEEQHVPAYYRESPFSRAWMKMTKIERRPEFFGRFSFAEAPEVANYTSSALARFQNKKIADADELRSMDTTIWRVRDELPGDASERILLSVRELGEAVSTEVVRCKSDVILHLTDIHFSLDPHRKKHVWRYESETDRTRHTMTEAITIALKSRKVEVGMVVVSGDLTFLGSEGEFEKARTAISLLLGNLDLSTDHLVVVPGNHDIQWTTDAKYDHNSPVKEAPDQAKRNYQNFYRKLFRHEPNRHLSMARRFALPSGITIELCAVNSSSLETGKKFLAGMGKVDEAAIGEAAVQLGWTSDRTLALRLLVLHHHLALTEDLEPSEGYGRGYGLAVDAPRIQRLAASKGVHLVLHGHKHRSFIWRQTVYELPERARMQHKLGHLAIVGGGSAASLETEGAANYFNLISVEPGQLNLEIFQSTNQGAFGLIQKWSAELHLSQESGGLKLGEWNHIASDAR